jgi:UDP-N-acetylglucosamine--N-acetylmuramyl-(pentapeptide) pyrophosphoryl-undecaprenol N-acetylglucosamine transferase
MEMTVSRLRTESLRVLFAGGGTGGHIIPGVAVAESLRQIVPGVRCLFLTGSRSSESRCLQALGTLETMPFPETPWSGLHNKLLFPLRGTLAAARMVGLLRRWRPHVVVGLGSYNCVAPVLTARALGVRTALLEANAVPGRAVRLLAPFVNRVLVQWPETARHLPTPHVVAAGNPTRAGLSAATRHGAMRRLALNPNRCTMLVMGGSQGARALNDIMHEALKLLDDQVAELQVIHLTGAAHLAVAQQRCGELNMLYRPIGYMDRMQDAYAAADFVVGRAGASSLAELTLQGLPSILVPIPHSINDHQAANARVLQDAAAAVTIPQVELTPKRLADAIRGLTDNSRLRAWMGRRAHDLGRPQAARTIATTLAAMAGFTARQPQETTSRTRRNRAA